MTSNKVLITGIFGQDAAYLADIALKSNFKVIGGARHVSHEEKYWRLEHLGIRQQIEYVEMDMQNDASIFAAITEHQPQLIFNLAAQSSVAESFARPYETLDITMMGAVRLLEAVRRHAPSTRLFQPSSAETTSPAGGGQCETEPVWRSAYAAAKACASGIAKLYRKQYGLFVANAVLHNHESALRGDAFVSKKIARALVKIHLGQQDRLQLGNLDSRRDWSHARDFMQAAWKILQLDQAEDFTLSSGNIFSVREFVNICGDFLGMNIEWRGQGMEEIGILKNSGREIISVDPSFFRPVDPLPDRRGAEDTFSRLAWKPSRSIHEIAQEIIEYELSNAKGN